MSFDRRISSRNGESFPTAHDLGGMPALFGGGRVRACAIVAAVGDRILSEAEMRL
jgi:hypothetical protein